MCQQWKFIVSYTSCLLVSSVCSALLWERTCGKCEVLSESGVTYLPPQALNAFSFFNSNRLLARHLVVLFLARKITWRYNICIQIWKLVCSLSNPGSPWRAKRFSISLKNLLEDTTTPPSHTPLPTFHPPHVLLLNLWIISVAPEMHLSVKLLIAEGILANSSQAEFFGSLFRLWSHLSAGALWIFVLWMHRLRCGKATPSTQS